MLVQFGAPELIYTEHAIQRMPERGITTRAVQLAYRYGTKEIVDSNEVRYVVDFAALQRLFDVVGKEAFQYFDLICVIKEGNVVATVYWKGDFDS